MSEIISVRVNKQLDKLIKLHIAESNHEQADVLREMIKNGGIFIAIQGYASGKYSTEKAASLAGLPLAEFIDLILRLGIRSNIELGDMIDAAGYLEQLAADNKMQEK
jgi:predicted HTH domain antitoxin